MNTMEHRRDFVAELRAARIRRITDEQKKRRREVIVRLVDLSDASFDLVIAVRDFCVALADWISYEVKT